MFLIHDAIRDFRKLGVWNKAIELVKEVYKTNFDVKVHKPKSKNEWLIANSEQPMA